MLISFAPKPDRIPNPSNLRPIPFSRKTLFQAMVARYQQPATREGVQEPPPLFVVSRKSARSMPRATPPSMERRIFWSVLAALLAFSGIMFVLFVLGAFSVHVAAQQAAEQQAQAAQQWLSDQERGFARATAQAEQAQAAQQQAQAQRSAADLAARTLSADQRCYLGSVVEVHGSTFTQLGSISNPIHCAGNLADKPLR